MPRRVLSGLVVSDKMDKTITVLVERRVMHPKYKKYVKKSSKYAVHDEGNVCKAGDVVSIEECRPISKNKSWKVIDGVSKGKKLAITPFDAATRVSGPAEAPKTAKVKLAVKKEKPAADKEKAAKKPAAKAPAKTK
jgi:small subunit ribosomal protein S17